MDPKIIKELMIMMERHQLKKLSYKDKSGSELCLERESASSPPTSACTSAFPLHGSPTSPLVVTPSASRNVDPQGDASSLLFVSSPMVGTFYKAASPTAPPFVQVGDFVTVDTIVCVVEAMKVMNEVKAGVSGQVVSMLIADAHPVEYGTKLFSIKPK